MRPQLPSNSTHLLSACQQLHLPSNCTVPVRIHFSKETHCCMLGSLSAHFRAHLIQHGLCQPSSLLPCHFNPQSIILTSNSRIIETPELNRDSVRDHNIMSPVARRDGAKSPPRYKEEPAPVADEDLVSNPPCSISIKKFPNPSSLLAPACAASTRV